MSAKPEIRVLDAAGVDLLVDWAADEGWNPGLHDAAAFRAADPDGFLGLFLEGELASAVSVVAYGGTFGFLGFYICRPDLRGKGYGKAVWDAGLARLGSRIVGLDGVVAQQENYAREGFRLAHRNIRFSGVPSFRGAPDLPLVALDPDSPSGLLDLVCAYDRSFFPADRTPFIADWVSSPHRRTIACLSDHRLCGFGTVRACRSGYKIGPLFADDEEVAEALLAALVREHPGAVHALDVPEPNAAGCRLARRFGLSPSFETARMYRGGLPDLPLRRIFGITTFELG